MSWAGLWVTVMGINKTVLVRLRQGPSRLWLGVVMGYGYGYTKKK